VQPIPGYVVRPAGPGDWPAVEQVLDTPGDPRRCWCQYFLLRGRAWSDAPAGDLRDALRAQVTGGDTPGLVAYHGDRPVGWVQVGPWASFPRLASSRISGGDPAQGPPERWAVTCFVVPRPHRGLGLARLLLEAAVDHAAGAGALAVEGYPVDTEVSPASQAELYHGTLRMFLDAGFSEVRRPAPRRPVVRRAL